MLSCLQNAGNYCNLWYINQIWTFFNFSQLKLILGLVHVQMFLLTSFPASFSLPFVNEAYKECQNIERIIELDGIMQAYLSNHVANRASLRQVSFQFSKCWAFRWNPLRNRVIGVFDGQKSCTTILLSIWHPFMHFLKAKVTNNCLK